MELSLSSLWPLSDEENLETTETAIIENNRGQNPVFELPMPFEFEVGYNEMLGNLLSHGEGASIEGDPELDSREVNLQLYNFWEDLRFLEERVIGRPLELELHVLEDEMRIVRMEVYDASGEWMDWERKQYREWEHDPSEVDDYIFQARFHDRERFAQLTEDEREEVSWFDIGEPISEYRPTSKEEFEDLPEDDQYVMGGSWDVYRRQVMHLDIQTDYGAASNYEANAIEALFRRHFKQE